MYYGRPEDWFDVDIFHRLPLSVVTGTTEPCLGGNIDIMRRCMSSSRCGQTRRLAIGLNLSMLFVHVFVCTCIYVSSYLFGSIT